MKIVDFAVRNSLVVNLLSVLVVIAGIMVVSTMTREAFPNVTYDMVLVETTYPGSTPQEVEKQVSIPLEDELNEIDGIDEMRSVSVEGLSILLVQLDPDARNKPKIVNDIQRAVDRVSDLPDEADDPVVEEVETHNLPIMIVTLTGPDIWQLRETAESLEDLLEDLPGVASVNKEGWQDSEIWVEVDPAKLKALHLSLDEVVRALSGRNLNLPGGKLYLEGQEHLIRTVGEFETPEEIEEVIIRANESGYWLRIKDVAKVRYSLEEQDRIEKMNGQRAINLVVVKKESADTLKLAGTVQAFVDDYQAQLTNGVTVFASEDLSLSYVRRRLKILINNLSCGIGFLMIALMLFLSGRVAFLTAMGIPIAVLATFLILPTFGMNINLLSMFGFVLVLGMLVDDGIVVSENCFRYLERGMSPQEAAIKGTSEVVAPVTATILTTISAFAPLMFMSGLIGRFVWVIPAVVITALVASLVESVVVLPSHIADFARPQAPEGTTRFKRLSRAAWFKRLRRIYMWMLKTALKGRWLVFGGFVAAFLVTGLVATKFMRFTLFPSAGAQTFFIKIEGPTGTSLEELDTQIFPLEEAITKIGGEDLSHFVTRLGIQQEWRDEPATRRGSNVGQIQVYMSSRQKRLQSAAQIIQGLRKTIVIPEGFEISYELVRTGPPVGKPVEVHLRGDHYPVLEEAAEAYKEVLRSIDGVSDVKDDYEPGKPEYKVLVNEQQAKRAGLGVRDIAETVRAAYDGRRATTIKLTDEEIDVVVRFPEVSQEDPETLKQLVVENPQGHLVPLTRIVDVKREEGVSFIKHLDRKRSISVTADVDESVVTSLQVHQKLDHSIPDFLSRFPGVTVRYGGEQEKTQESMAGLGRAFIIAAGVMYVILATTFQSLFHPVVVMLSIPFGVIGVAWAFFFHGEPLSFMTMLGVVGLSGVVVNDSIILVTFINRVRRSGQSMKRAILTSGYLRFRPVILTTITTMVGLAPVAYGIGGLDPFLKPAALAMVWGLATATVLTLILIPCVYAMLDDVQRWGRRLKPKKRSASVA